MGVVARTVPLLEGGGGTTTVTAVLCIAPQSLVCLGTGVSCRVGIML